MGEQPATGVKRGAFIPAARRERPEHGAERQWIALLIQGLRPMHRRAAKPDRPVRIDLRRPHEFGEPLNEPRRVGGRYFLEHQMMRIFVEKHDVGLEQRIARHPARDNGDRARGAGTVETGDPVIGAALQPLHFERAGDDEYDQAITITDRRIGHLAGHPDRFVEPLELLREAGEFGRAFIGVNDEVRRGGALPAGSCGRSDGGSHQRGDQEETQTRHLESRIGTAADRGKRRTRQSRGCHYAAALQGVGLSGEWRW